MDIGSLLGAIEIQDQFTANFTKFELAMDKAGSSYTKMGSQLTQAGTIMTVGITAPLVAAAAASLSLSATFEASMTRLVSLAGVSAGELEGVKQHILDLAPAVGIGPQALADAMTKISSTTNDTNVALQILDISAKGSAAGMGSALDVAGALTAVVNSYGKENITAARAADILTKAVQDGGAEAKDLAPTLANVVPLAAQMGIGFEEVGANLATLTKLGVPASEAVTSLTSVISGLMKETHKGEEALKMLGMSYGDLRKEVKEKGLAATLTDLTLRFGDNKTALAAVFGRIEALKNVMGTAGQQATIYAEEVKRMADTAEGSAGALGKAYDAMAETQVKTWGQVTAQIQVVGIQLGNALAPAMMAVLNAAKPLLAVIVEMATWFKNSGPVIQTTVIAAAALAAVIGPMVVVLGTVVSSIGTLLPLWGATTTAVGLLGNTVPVLTARIWLMDAAAAASSTTLGGFLIASGPLIVAVAAITAAVVIGYQAWQLYSEHSERAAANARQNTVDQANLERISKVAGKTFTDLGEATKWATQHAKELRDAHVTQAAATTQAGAATGKATILTKEAVAAAEKHAKELGDVNAIIALARQSVGQLTDTQKASVVEYEKLGLTVDQIATKLGVSSGAVTLYEKELKKTDETTKAIQGSTENLTTKFGFFGSLIRSDLIEHTKEFQERVRNLSSTMNEFHGGLSVMGDEMGTVTIPLFTDLGQNVVPKAKEAIDGVREASLKLGSTLKGDLKSSLGGIADTIARAFEGGGGLSGALKSIAVRLGQDFGKTLMENVKTSVDAGGSGLTALSGKAAAATGAMAGLGAAFSGASTKASVASAAMAGVGVAASAIGAGATVGGALALGAATAGIGIAAVGAYVAIKHMLNDPEKKINPLREQFVQAAGGLQGLNEKAMAATGSLALVNQLLAAKNQEQFKAATDALNLAFQAEKDLITGVNTELGTLLGQADQMGIRLPASLQGAVDKLVAMGKITGDNAALFAQLTGSTEVDFGKMQGIAQKYGIDLANLGPQFQSAKLHDSAKTIINDFEMLTANGANVDGVLAGMKDEINSLVSDSIKFGVAIPENMKPWIEQLAVTGQLLDDNGVAITDISSLQFSPPIVTEFQKIVTKIQELIDKLAGPLTKAVQNIPSPVVDVTLNGHWNIPALPEGAGSSMASVGGRITSSGVQYLASGGPVLHGPWGLPRGTDTVPIMGTPGEGIVTTRGMQAIGNDGLSAINSGKTGRGSGADVQRLERRMARRDAELPTVLARAVRDEVQKVARRR